MPAPKKQTFTPINATIGDTAIDLLRAGGQGLSFGFADEIEAIIRSGLNKDKSYKDIVEEIRTDIEKFRERSPVMAYGTEIAASLPTAILGGAGIAKAGATAAKAGLTGAAKLGKGVGTQSAIQGAVYGAGAAEEGERLGGAALGGAIGGAIGKAGDVVLPKVGTAAKQYMEKFAVKPDPSSSLITKGASKLGLTKPSLTIGQKYAGGDAGILGNLINVLEETATGVPGIGSSIQTARLKNIIDYNSYNLNKAIEPLGVKLPKGLTGQEAYTKIDDIINDAYDKVLPKINIKDTDPFYNKIGELIDQSDLGQDGLNKVYSFISKNILDKIDNGQIKGENIKKIESALGNEIKKYSKAPGFEADIGELFKKIQLELRNQIDLQNKSLPELQAVNKAFYNAKRIEDAVIKSAKNQGLFTPSQMIGTMKKLDPSKGKKDFAKGKLPMQKETQIAEQTLGGRFPESGTASRIIAGGMVQDPGKAFVYAIPGIGSDIAYSRPVSTVLGGLLNLPGRLARKGSPSVGGQAGGLLAPSLYNQYFGGQ